VSLVRDRPTADLVVLLLAGLISTILLIATAGVVVLAIVRPEADLTAATNVISSAVKVMLGALVGFVTGRNLTADRDAQQQVNAKHTRNGAP
jgi:membrane protein YqaA with SNARE-associated domain